MKIQEAHVRLRRKGFFVNSGGPEAVDYQRGNRRLRVELGCDLEVVRFVRSSALTPAWT